MASDQFQLLAPAYLALLHQFPLRPLYSLSDLKLARRMLRWIDQISRVDLTLEQQWYRDVLRIMVANYETAISVEIENHGAPDTEVLRFFMITAGYDPEEQEDRERFSRDVSLPHHVTKQTLLGQHNLSREEIAILYRYGHLNRPLFDLRMLFTNHSLRR